MSPRVHELSSLPEHSLHVRSLRRGLLAVSLKDLREGLATTLLMTGLVVNPNGGPCTVRMGGGGRK